MNERIVRLLERMYDTVDSRQRRQERALAALQRAQSDFITRPLAILPFDSLPPAMDVFQPFLVFVIDGVKQTDTIAGESGTGVLAYFDTSSKQYLVVGLDTPLANIVP